MSEQRQVEWWYFARDSYAKAKKPQWRNPMPSKTEVQSQKRLWAMAFAWRDQNPDKSPHDTADLMRVFISSWLRWSQSVPDVGNESMWTLLSQFVESSGQLDSGTPEATVRVALKVLPKRAQMALLLKLANELV